MRHVIARSPLERVVAATAGEGVIAKATVERINALTAREHVIARPPFQYVVNTVDCGVLDNAFDLVVLHFSRTDAVFNSVTNFRTGEDKLALSTHETGGISSLIEGSNFFNETNPMFNHGNGATLVFNGHTLFLDPDGSGSKGSAFQIAEISNTAFSIGTLNPSDFLFLV